MIKDGKPVYAHVEDCFGKVGTICITYNPELGVANVGASFCSKEDRGQFNKKIGRKYALRNSMLGIEKCIPPSCRREFDETLDYLMGVATRKFFDGEENPYIIIYTYGSEELVSHN